MAGDEKQQKENALEGVLTFYNEENGYLIGKLKGGRQDSGGCSYWESPKSSVW